MCRFEKKAGFLGDLGKHQFFKGFIKVYNSCLTHQMMFKFLHFKYCYIKVFMLNDNKI